MENDAVDSPDGLFEGVQPPGIGPGNLSSKMSSCECFKAYIQEKQNKKQQNCLTLISACPFEECSSDEVCVGDEDILPL